MSKDSKPDDDYHLTILKDRLAKGEITIEEFEKLKEKLAETNYPESARKEFVGIAEKVGKLQKEQLESQKKSAGVTLILSALCGLVGILGIGHCYTGSKKRGIAFLLPGLFLVLVILLLVLSPTILPQNPGVEQFSQKVVTSYFATLYGFVYLGLYFVQIFDAQRSCRKYNLSLAKTGSLKGKQITFYRSKMALAVVLGILVIIGAITANDLSQNIPKVRSLQQEQQTADQQNHNSQQLSGNLQAYENWRQCAQNAGSSYLSVCGNPPQSPFSNQPVDCSLASNHWLCNPYYTESSQGKSSVSQAGQVSQLNPSSPTTTQISELTISPDLEASMNWIKDNTPQDSIVASWLDTGYWIETIGNRKAIVDNSTMDTEKVAEIEKMFYSSPSDGWKILQQLHANYVVFHVYGASFTSNGKYLYVLAENNKETTKPWFEKMDLVNASKYLESDGFTPTDQFWNDTLLGKMLPFTPVVYFDQEKQVQSPKYTIGSVGIYEKSIKFNSDNDPVKLVYSSPGLDQNGEGGPVIAVLVYQVNNNYTATNQP